MYHYVAKGVSYNTNGCKHKHVWFAWPRTPSLPEPNLKALILTSLQYSGQLPFYVHLFLKDAHGVAESPTPIHLKFMHKATPKETTCKQPTGPRP